MKKVAFLLIILIAALSVYIISIEDDSKINVELHNDHKQESIYTDEVRDEKSTEVLPLATKSADFSERNNSLDTQIEKYDSTLEVETSVTEEKISIVTDSNGNLNISNVKDIVSSEHSFDNFFETFYRNFRINERSIKVKEKYSSKLYGLDIVQSGNVYVDQFECSEVYCLSKVKVNSVEDLESFIYKIQTGEDRITSLIYGEKNNVGFIVFSVFDNSTINLN
jgi:hypothetical protein